MCWLVLGVLLSYCSPPAYTDEPAIDPLGIYEVTGLELLQIRDSNNALLMEAELLRNDLRITREQQLLSNNTVEQLVNSSTRLREEVQFVERRLYLWKLTSLTLGTATVFLIIVNVLGANTPVVVP